MRRADLCARTRLILVNSRRGIRGFATRLSMGMSSIRTHMIIKMYAPEYLLLLCIISRKLVRYWVIETRLLFSQRAVYVNRLDLSNQSATAASRMIRRTFLHHRPRLTNKLESHVCIHSTLELELAWFSSIATRNTVLRAYCTRMWGTVLVTFECTLTTK